MSVSEHRKRGVHERDYLEKTIETVRQHAEADNCWPQWANIFADEIERLWKVEAATWVPAPTENGGVQCIICGTVCDTFLPGQIERTKRMHRSVCPKASA
jgi:hypothetical protein